ncbi:MAG: DUF4190 domain-containing protein [Phycisphaerales bacterium]|nr:DUF4190 domain-containing protein [Phycisphaerales bacterium]
MVEPPPIIQPSGYACIECGYDLSGTAIGGQCPECGRATVDSLRGLPVATPNSSLPVTALVLGIVSIVSLFVCMPLVICGPFALALGWKALRDIRSGAIVGSAGMAMAGIVMGTLGSVLVVFFVAIIFAAFASTAF